MIVRKSTLEVWLELDRAALHVPGTVRPKAGSFKSPCNQECGADRERKTGFSESSRLALAALPCPSQFACGHHHHSTARGDRP